MIRRKIYSCSWIFILLLFSSTCLYAGWNGFSYVHDEPLSGTQTNTGTLFQLTIAPPAGYEFVTASGYNGAKASLSGGNAIGIKILLRSASSDSYLLEMGGKLREVTETAGGNGTEKLFDWNAKAECEKAFYIESNQAGNLKEIIVPAGTSVTYTAYEGTSPKASNWTVNGVTKNNESSIIFNRSWWDVPGWYSTSMETPDPGTYDITARPTDNAGVSDSGNMTIVGIASISGHGKSSTRNTLPNDWTDTNEIIFAQPKSVINLTINLDPDVTPNDNLKASISWTVSGMATTITPNESKLGATFIPDSTGDYIVTASCGESQRLICIKVSAPKLYSVSFNGKIPILRDTGGEYSGVAWQDSKLQGRSDMEGANADSNKKYQPVAYCSTATMSATAIFKLNYKNSNGEYVNYDAEAAVKKLRFAPSLSPGDWSAPVDFNMAGTTVTAAHSIKPNAQVGYESNYMLAWEVGFGETGTADSDLSWERCYSEHELYLTYKGQISSYETVFHIGCTNANGKSNDQQIVSSIWNEFTGRNIKRKDGTLLSYYRSYLTSATSVAMLLQQKDGQCASWADFFQTALKCHGIDSDYIMFKPQDLSVNGFLVKTWSFSGTGTSGNVKFPYVNTFSSLDKLVDSSQYNWGSPAEVLYITGTAGQNNPKPASLFNNHQIIRYNGIYYDPSYGIQHASIQSIDDSLSGFFIINTTHNNTTPNALFLQKNPVGIQINTFILQR